MKFNNKILLFQGFPKNHQSFQYMWRFRHKEKNPQIPVG
jgi:hypothetical protein